MLCFKMLPIFLLEEASALIRVKMLQIISGRVSSSVNWTFRVATKSESKSTWAQSPASQKRKEEFVFNPDGEVNKKLKQNRSFG